MKKQLLRRLLSLALCMSMLVALTACGAKETEKEEAETEVAVQETEQETEEALEPITLTLGIGTSYWAGGNGVFTDQFPVLQWLKEQTGVEIEFVSYDADRLTMMSAGGDLPDLYLADVATDPTTFNIIESGQLLPLDDLLDQYGENIVSKQSSANAAAKSKYGKGETTYLFPTRVSTPDGSVVHDVGGGAFRVRYDIYKEIGSPEYETEEELLDVVKQMQDYAREKYGDETIYGFSSYFQEGLWNIYCYLLARGIYSLEGDMTFEIAYNSTDIQPSVGNSDSAWWEGVEFFNKAYRAGVLDPESLTQDVNAWLDKSMKNKAVAAIDWPRAVDASLAGEGAIFAALPMGPFEYVNNVYGAVNPAGQLFYGISTNCEDPERAMQFLNFLWSDEFLRTAFNGLQGESWDFDEEGQPVFIGELAAAYAEDVEAATVMFNEVSMEDDAIYWWCAGNQLPMADGKRLSAKDHPDHKALTPNAAYLAFAQDFGDYTVPSQVYDQWIREGKMYTDNTDIDNRIVLGSKEGLSTESSQILISVTNYLMTNVADLVLAESEAEFEKNKEETIAYLKDLGVDQVYEEHKQAYEKSYEAYQAAK